MAKKKYQLSLAKKTQANFVQTRKSLVSSHFLHLYALIPIDRNPFQPLTVVTMAAIMTLAVASPKPQAASILRSASDRKPSGDFFYTFEVKCTPQLPATCQKNDVFFFRQIMESSRNQMGNSSQSVMSRSLL